MTKEQINRLRFEGRFSKDCVKPELVETHISWVLLCNRFAYKIKKPIQYSFIDFSTIERRKFYCEKEIELNTRLTKDVYLDVLPVREIDDEFFVGKDEGKIIDYTVQMRKLNREKQMNILLENNKVSPADIVNLAKKIAAFHKRTNIIFRKDVLEIREKFSDLDPEKNYLKERLDVECWAVITDAIKTSNIFVERNKGLLKARSKSGFFRDCHGDLHSKNIFLLPSPQPFDCIEFNDDFRQIDVLNEVAFLCMDLDAFKKQDLSELFINSYNTYFPCIKSEADKNLFIYYKSYRANVRAKVNSLRAKSCQNDVERKLILAEAKKYLELMDGYMEEIREP